ncbi:MAG: virulence-associated E family protein, partial [Eubacteriales bacterium]|nr:virulence-associated E family protein [Eubacteriales bacterium]
YDDKFAYSHHATDPACGHLMNAFDVVRVHKFGSLDDKAKLGTPAHKLPSYVAMTEFAIGDERVKLQLAKEREMAAYEDFAEDDDNWQAMLELNKTGGVKDTMTNFALILRHDPRLSGICYNELTCSIDIRDTENLPWKPLKPGWADADVASLNVYIDQVYHIYSPNKVKSAILKVTQERAYHPIKEYFDSLPEWDGVARVEKLLIDYLGAEDSIYTRAVSRKILVAAAARIYEPGVKFDEILVLCGAQGIGKSTFFARLAGRWFSDSLSISDMRDKTGPEKLQGFWIMEISEMNGIKKVDVETVKSFASRQDDKFRVAYGTVVESHPRQCIIVGTTNTMSGFLRDITGNRRFWPVNCEGHTGMHPWDLNASEIDQIWAEALTLYHAGEELILTGEAEEQARAMQQEALEADDREGLVRQYLEKLLPENWNSMGLSERRMFLSGDEFTASSNTGTMVRTKVCNIEIWAECFGRDPASLQRQDSYAISAIMKKIEGWDRYDGNKSGKLSFGAYGPQIAYVKKEEEEELPFV